MDNLSIPPDWLPVAAINNALPLPLRRYIHDLETNCDPAGMVREAIVQRENASALAVRVRELEAACRTAKEERNVARSRAWELARERRGAAALVQKLAAAEARTDEVIATLGPDVERLTGERDRARGLLRERAWCEHCCGGGRRFGEACARCAGTGYPAPVWAEIGGEGE